MERGMVDLISAQSELYTESATTYTETSTGNIICV